MPSYFIQIDIHTHQQPCITSDSSYYDVLYAQKNRLWCFLATSLLEGFFLQGYIYFSVWVFVGF